MEACLPGARIDVRGITRDAHRPEESALAESWVKVVYLVREVRSRRPLEDVESDEPEGGMLLAAGKVGTPTAQSTANQNTNHLRSAEGASTI